MLENFVQCFTRSINVKKTEGSLEHAPEKPDSVELKWFQLLATVSSYFLRASRFPNVSYTSFNSAVIFLALAFTEDFLSGCNCRDISVCCPDIVFRCFRSDAKFVIQ